MFSTCLSINMLSVRGLSCLNSVVDTWIVHTGLVSLPFSLSTAHLWTNSPVELEVEPRKCFCVIGLPLGSQMVFKAGGLGNILKFHNMNSVCSSFKAQSHSKQLSLLLTTDYCGLPMPPGSFMASSENMNYPIGFLDWQDLTEVVRQSSGKAVWTCALSRAKKHFGETLK